MNAKTCPLRLFPFLIPCLVAVALIAPAWSVPAFCGPIHDAARYGDLQKIEALLKDNPELIFSKDNYGNTPLYIAASTGNKGAAKLLLANKAEVNVKGEGEWTPLHAAAANGHKDVVELLLAKKAEVNAKTKYGETPLRMAVKWLHKEAAELLRQHGGKE
jgi:ankyrin repeat protein